MAAFDPTATFSPTDLQYTIPTRWAKEFNKWFESKLVTAGFFLNLSDEVADGGGTIRIPDLFTNMFTASDKTNASAVTLESPAQSYLDLSVNTWKERSFLIEDKEAAQIIASYELQKAYMEQANYIVRKAFDTSMLTLYSGLSQTVGDTALNLTDARIREAIATLDANDTPQEDRAFIFHTAPYWQDVHGIAKYYKANELGTMKGPTLTGQIDTLYGIPVLLTNQIVSALGGYYNLLAHKIAFAYATAKGWGVEGSVRLQSTYLQEYLGTLNTADVVYGVGIYRNSAAVVIKTNTTGFVS